MEFWHDLVCDYSDFGVGKDRAIDHGTFSESATVILLMHLAFGSDYPTNISKFFSEFHNKGFKGLNKFDDLINEKNEEAHLKRKIPSALMYPTKVSSILKRMNDDKLIILKKKVSAGAGRRSYYALNPKIIFSPAVDDTYFNKLNGLPTVSIETIENFLDWMDTSQREKIDKSKEEEQRKKRHERSDDILSVLINYGSYYFVFLFLLEIKARKWEQQIHWSDHQTVLSKHIHAYIHEFDQNIKELPPHGFDIKNVDPLPKNKI
jgi:hypothetical protein